jgi:molybdopterin-binding protein
MEKHAMRLSARIQIKGTVSTVTKGATTGHVVVDIGNGQTIMSSITNDSIDELGIKAGSKVTVIALRGVVGPSVARLSNAPHAGHWAGEDVWVPANGPIGAENFVPPDDHRGAQPYRKTRFGTV